MLPEEQKLRSANLTVDRSGGAGNPCSIVVQDICKVYKLFSSPIDRMKEVLHPCGKKYHKQFEALSNVSFKVEKGDVVGIIGRNGSGKTTLLQLISGIIHPTSGSVTVDGRISALLELGTGFNPELSGRQNVYICGSIIGLSRQEIDDCFSSIVTFSGISEFIDQPVRTYSNGMYIRLAFSLAINVKPDILVVDEALAVGDTPFQAKCFAQFREFQQKGTTIIFVTHSSSLITRLCNKACLLDGGKLITFGKPKHVIDMYGLVISNKSSNFAVAMNRNAISDIFDNENLRKCISGHFFLNPAEVRYGNGMASIDRIEIYNNDGNPVQNLIKNGEYKFCIHVVFLEHVISPIFSYRIRARDGIDVSGTNTLYHNVETGIFEPEDKVLVSFSQRIRVKTGEYFLSASCAGFENGEYVVYDRRYDAVPFLVTALHPCDGLVDLDTKISLYREGGATIQSKL